VRGGRAPEFSSRPPLRKRGGSLRITPVGGGVKCIEPLKWGKEGGRNLKKKRKGHL